MSDYHEGAKTQARAARSNLEMVQRQMAQTPHVADGQVVATMALTQAVLSVASSLIHMNEERGPEEQEGQA